MFWCWFFVLSTLPLIRPTLSTTCQPRAVSLPLKTYPLKTRPQQARGISFRIGNPLQQTVLLPNAYYSGTYVWNTSSPFCSNGEPIENCYVYRGGPFSAKDSSTANVTKTFRGDDNSPATWTRDNVQLQNTTGSGLDLGQFEFGVRADGGDEFVQQGELGLGTNSSFLKAIADGNKTSSHSWALFWGTEVTRAPRDGSLIIGGYDEALIDRSSPNITLPFNRADTKCKEGMIVNITAISLDTFQGKQNVMSSLSPLTACVVPTVSNLLTLPVRYWDRIAANMKVDLYPYRNGTADTYLYNTTIVKKDKDFTGSFSITLNSTLEITIPNEQIRYNEMYIYKGVIANKSDVKNIPIVRSDDLIPRIGGMFFSAAYLMVNHDKNQFTITKAQTTPATQKLMAFDTANDCVAALNVTGASPPPQSPSPTPSPRFSSGAIGGIVVGGLGGLTVVAGLLFFFWRRKRHAASVPESDVLLNTYVPAEKYGNATAETYADHGIAELAHHGDSRHFVTELDSTQLPLEAPQQGVLSPREGPAWT